MPLDAAVATQRAAQVNGKFGVFLSLLARRKTFDPQRLSFFSFSPPTLPSPLQPQVRLPPLPPEGAAGNLREGAQEQGEISSEGLGEVAQARVRGRDLLLDAGGRGMRGKKLRRKKGRKS